MPKEIKFGTDGWRGIIADDYTFDNVRRVGGAIAAYVLKNEDASKGLSSATTRVSAPRISPSNLRSHYRSGHSRPPVERLHAHARDFLLREALGHRRRRRHHLQPQSVHVEWREVQGEVWRIGAARH